MENLQVRPLGRRIAVLVSALGSLLSGCGDPKNPPPKFHLEGSLTQVMDLGYDEARVLLAPEDVSLLFVRRKPRGADPGDGGAQSTTEDYPLKVAYRLLGEAAGGRVDLAAVDSGGAQRGTISRSVAGDPRTKLPSILRGTLSFDRALAPNAVVGGEFRVTFDNGIEVASGRTAFSTFSARVQP